MGFEIRTSPRGVSALWGGRQLASAYDAAKEAVRWAAGVNAAPGSLVFVAGDPWGLASRALLDAGVQAVALLLGGAARRHLPEGVRSWAPEDGELGGFVRDLLDEWGTDAVSWQVWPAFERYAGELSLDWARTFRDAYRMAQGSWLTQTRFGPRFWANAVRNAVGWERPVTFLSGSRPIVIAASGPSLEDALPALAEHRPRFELWALPSSFEVLLKRGLVPDAGVATDGGYYAREHLHRLVSSGVPLMAALTSAPDASLEGRPCLFFSQGMDIERRLLGALFSGFGEIPSRGTVAVTAIELALTASTAPVFVVGLDLSFRGLRAHAMPHTVDRRHLSSHGRLTPYEGLAADALFVQAPVVSEGALTTSALLTYAGWFRRAKFRREVFRVAPSALRWNSMTEIGIGEAARRWSASRGEPWRWRTVEEWPSRNARRRSADAVLEQFLDRLAACAEDDPWLVEAARTGAPRELARDLQARRVGQRSDLARAGLVALIRGLRDR